MILFIRGLLSLLITSLVEAMELWGLVGKPVVYEVVFYVLLILAYALPLQMPGDLINRRSGHLDEVAIVVV